MQASPVLLSICIPTFNRASLLKATLESIVAQDAFNATDDIEVVIGDNHSNDETDEIVTHFMQRFPGKIVLLRHESNIGAEKNYNAVLKAGRGQFLKLHNDYLLVHAGALQEIVKVVRSAVTLKPTIFMLNGNRPNGSQLQVVANLDEFVRAVSYFSTWIGAFGIWRDDFRSISNFVENEASRLIQTHILFKLVSSGRGTLILHGSYFAGQSTPRKDGYNFTQVFGKNYLAILKKYLIAGKITQDTFDREKKDLLLRHILPYYFDNSNCFEKMDFFEHLADYQRESYFYEAIAGHLPHVWRLSNPHNDTKLVKIAFPSSLRKIKVGRKSYGNLNIVDCGNENERLTIGNFVSIAENVSFILGGNCADETVSTYPFRLMYRDEIEAQTKGPINIGDDVWIGYGALIVSGVTVGQGAVIAAGSVVTEDISPYAVVGGNPAKVLKYRFGQEVIDKLCAFDFSCLDDQTIRELGDELYISLDENNVDALLRGLGQHGNVSTEHARIERSRVTKVAGTQSAIGNRIRSKSEA